MSSPPFEQLLVRARTAKAAGRLSEAIEWFEMAHREGAPAEECQPFAAPLLYQLQRFDEAAAAFRAALKLYPEDTAARCGLARSLDKLQRWSEAAQEFRIALQYDPARADAKLALGICLLRLDQNQEALAIFEERLTEDPEEQVSLLGKAVALHRGNRFGESDEIYRRLVAREPGLASAFASFGVSEPKPRPAATRPPQYTPQMLAGLASAAFAGGDYAAAEQHCAELTVATPDSFEGWFNLGVARQRLSRLREAATAYERAIALQPGSAQAHLALAVVRHASGDLPGAAESYDKALKLNGDLEIALWNAGLLHETQRDMRAAEDLYGHLVELLPSSSDAWFRLGYVRLERGDFRGSVAALETCLRLRPDSAEATYNLGLAYWRLDRYDRAQSLFESALAMPEPPAPARRALAALTIDNRDYAGALKWHMDLIERGDRSLDVLYNAALLQHEAGELDQAIELYQLVLQKDPDYADALLNLGLAQKACGDSLRAVSSCQRAVELKPELAERYFDRIAWIKKQSSGSPA